MSAYVYLVANPCDSDASFICLLSPSAPGGYSCVCTDDAETACTVYRISVAKPRQYEYGGSKVVLLGEYKTTLSSTG